MARKAYLIRFYYAHDLDLFTLMENHEFDVIRAIYTSLKAFANNEVFVIAKPPLREEPIKLKKIYRTNLYLDTAKDADIIGMLDKISNGYKNNFFKNLLRIYLGCPIYENFLIDEKDKLYFDTKLDMIRDNRKVVRAGKPVKKKKKNSQQVYGIENEVGLVSKVENVKEQDNNKIFVGMDITKEKEEPHREPALSTSMQKEEDHELPSISNQDAEDATWQDDITDLFAGMTQ